MAVRAQHVGQFFDLAEQLGDLASLERTLLSVPMDQHVPPTPARAARDSALLARYVDPVIPAQQACRAQNLG